MILTKRICQLVMFQQETVWTFNEVRGLPFRSKPSEQLSKNTLDMVSWFTVSKQLMSWVFQSSCSFRICALLLQSQERVVIYGQTTWETYVRHCCTCSIRFCTFRTFVTIWTLVSLLTTRSCTYSFSSRRSTRRCRRKPKSSSSIHSWAWTFHSSSSSKDCLCVLSFSTTMCSFQTCCRVSLSHRSKMWKKRPTRKISARARRTKSKTEYGKLPTRWRSRMYEDNYN
jgi:hypothetical protein